MGCALKQKIKKARCLAFQMFSQQKENKLKLGLFDLTVIVCFLAYFAGSHSAKMIYPVVNNVIAFNWHR